MRFVLLVVVTAFFSSCKKGDTPPDPPKVLDFSGTYSGIVKERWHGTSMGNVTVHKDTSYSRTYFIERFNEDTIGLAVEERNYGKFYNVSDTSKPKTRFSNGNFRGYSSVVSFSGDTMRYYIATWGGESYSGSSYNLDFVGIKVK
jgi:hypothetical protein